MFARWEGSQLFPRGHLGQILPEPHATWETSIFGRAVLVIDGVGYRLAVVVMDNRTQPERPHTSPRSPPVRSRPELDDFSADDRSGASLITR